MFEDDVFGSGHASLSGSSSVIFVAAHVLVVPWEARPLEVDDPDHYLRMGWFSLGDHFSVPGDATVRDWWRAPVWLDFLDSLWTPIPSGGAATTTVQATQIRWSIGNPGVVHLYVFGT